MRYKHEKGLNTDPEKIYLDLHRLGEEYGEALRYFLRADIQGMVNEIGDVLVVSLGILAIMKVDALPLIERIIDQNKRRDFSYEKSGEEIEESIRVYLGQ